MKKTLLIVDDSATQQMIMKSAAEKAGFSAMVIGDGDATLIHVNQHAEEICGITLDIFMPNVDGISTLGQLRNKHPEIPVVVVSGTEDEEIIATVKALGAIGFVQKPMTKEKFEHIFTLIRSNQL